MEDVDECRSSDAEDKEEKGDDLAVTALPGGGFEHA